MSKHFVIHFRYIPPEMMMAPGYCIDKERMGIEAETETEARKKFLDEVGPLNPDHFRIDEIEERS